MSDILKPKIKWAYYWEFLIQYGVKEVEDSRRGRHQTESTVTDGLSNNLSAPN